MDSIGKHGGGVLLQVAKIFVPFNELIACAPEIIKVCFFTLQ